MRRPTSQNRRPVLETFEPRRLFAAGAAATVTLGSSAPGPGNTTLYTYDVTLDDTGTGKIGTFWFAWTPGADYLASEPSTVTSPAGWSFQFQGSHNSADGTSILWTADTSSDAVQPGGSLPGFSFTTTDAPADIAGNARSHSGTPVTTSTVYSGTSPFSDAGLQFVATPPDAGGQLPTTTLAAPKVAKSYAFDGAVKLSATLKSSVSKKTPFSGTVTLVEDGETAGTATLAGNGGVKFSAKAIAPLATGDHALALVYSGDAAHAAITSAEFTLHVVAAKTKAKLTTSPAKAVLGQPLTLSASIAAKGTPDAAPSGTVTFKDGTTVLGTAELNDAGTASFTLDDAPAGTHAFTAVYAGDANFSAVTSAAKKVSLKAAR